MKSITLFFVGKNFQYRTARDAAAGDSAERVRHEEQCGRYEGERRKEIPEIERKRYVQKVGAVYVERRIDNEFERQRQASAEDQHPWQAPRENEQDFHQVKFRYRFPPRADGAHHADIIAADLHRIIYGIEQVEQRCEKDNAAERVHNDHHISADQVEHIKAIEFFGNVIYSVIFLGIARETGEYAVQHGNVFFRGRIVFKLQREIFGQAGGYIPVKIRIFELYDGKSEKQAFFARRALAERCEIGLVCVHDIGIAPLLSRADFGKVSGAPFS